MPEVFTIARQVYRWTRAGMSRLYWGCAGQWIRNPPLPDFPRAVLFICKGNICRSPYAGRYLRKIVGDRNLRGICSRSAGLEVRVSDTPPDLAVRIAKTMGVDLMDHRSKAVTADMVENADMIFTMEHRQAEYMRNTYPDIARKIFLLPLFDANPPPAGDSSLRYNIPDPYGKSEEEFIECFRKIERSIEGFLSRSDLHCEP